MTQLAKLFLFIYISSCVFSSNAIVPTNEDLKELSCKENGYHLRNQSIGLRTITCALRNSVSIQSIEKILGEPLFQTNTKADPYNYSSANTFNRYNPSAIEKLNVLYSEGELKPAVSAIYADYFRNIARHYYSIALSLKNSPEFNQKYLALYKDAISKNKPINQSILMGCRNLGVFFPDRERRFKGSYYMQSMKNSNVAFFWFRRQVDGSFEEIFNLLEKVVIDNDSKYYREVQAISVASVPECEVVNICPL